MLDYLKKVFQNNKILISVTSLFVVWFIVGSVIKKHSETKAVASSDERPDVVARYIEASPQARPRNYESYGYISLQPVNIVAFVDSVVTNVNRGVGSHVNKGSAVITLLDDIVARSPINGVVDSVNVVEGSAVLKGTVLASVIDAHQKDLFIEIDAPTNLRDKVHPKTSIRVIASDTITCHASVLRGSQDVDRNTGTFKITGAIDRCHYNISEENIPAKKYRQLLSHDQFVKVFVSTGELASYPAPSNAIYVDDEGELVIKTVDDNNIVHEHRVEIIEVIEGLAWVHSKDLHDDVRILTFGAGYYSEGEKASIFHSKASGGANGEPAVTSPT